MWRVLLITTLVLQQSLAAWLVPTAAPANRVEPSPETCCCCQAACDSVTFGCEADGPRRCGPSGTQRPLNSDATVIRVTTRLDARHRAGDPDDRADAMGASRRAARHRVGLAPRTAISDVESRAVPDARTRRAMLCVRTT
jgi:hypothetical protein